MIEIFRRDQTRIERAASDIYMIGQADGTMRSWSSRHEGLPCLRRRPRRLLPGAGRSNGADRHDHPVAPADATFVSLADTAWSNTLPIKTAAGPALAAAERRSGSSVMVDGFVRTGGVDHRNGRGRTIEADRDGRRRKGGVRSLETTESETSTERRPALTALASGGFQHIWVGTRKRDYPPKPTGRAARSHWRPGA
jgi:hypothetical protein